MNLLVFVLFAAIGMSIGSAAVASGTCTVTVNRQPCPGREKEALSPYKGKNPTTTSFSARDQAKCASLVQRAALIVRPEIFASVTAAGDFSGSSVQGASNNGACEALTKRLAEKPSKRFSKSVKSKASM